MSALRRTLGAAFLSGCMLAPVAVAQSLPQPGYVERPGTAQLVLSDIDQQQTIIDGSAGGLAIGGDSNQILAQVVTAGVSGFLTEVRFPVACDVTSDLVIEVQLVAAGKPNGLVLVSQHISGSDLPEFFPSPPSFRTLLLSTPVYRKGGSQFAIVLKSTGSCGVFRGPTGDPYARGNLYYDARPSVPGWVCVCSFPGDRFDLPFQTLMAPANRTHFDFDSDGKADIGVYRGATGEWFVHRSSDSGTAHVGWGAPVFGDIPVPADYDGDGRADIGVYRRMTGEWFINRSSNGTLLYAVWGEPSPVWDAPSQGDVPVPADYDGDGRADIAVYRTSTGQWFILNSAAGPGQVEWGAPSLGDVPVPADYDGDGRIDLAVNRLSTGEWFILRSSDSVLWHGIWGAPSLGDLPVVADYDGDQIADIAVFRETTGEWFVARSGGSGLLHIEWGSATLGDLPVPGDYDADGRSDIAVYRQTTGEWFILRSSDGLLSTFSWGAPSLMDRPLSYP